MPRNENDAGTATINSSSANEMDNRNSSKVTVEYHDPSGIFPLISEQLVEKLPLRNLHWKSPARPLRSIDSLHIDFVPSPDSSVDASDGSSNPAAPSSTGTRSVSQSGLSGDGSGAGDGAKSITRERRHQIPGLRQNPYLKIYLLRCDDNDIYKSSSRKLVREWMRNNGSSSSSTSNSLEHHDAFEWLIVHVVFPHTAAATQPRWSGSSGNISNTSIEKTNSSTRWPGRSSNTIFEKIRADFNVSSKSAPDRVAQVRLTVETMSGQSPTPAPSTTPSPASPPVVESSQEREHAWNDLIAKMKTLILMSFDLRVSQYEEDIREKDSQRALPGWNFCTFFLLKEGLARGFENVGLVEDALVGYDELSIGLDSVVREQAVKGNEGHGGVFPSYTDELLQELTAQKGGVSSDLQLCEKPLSTKRKRYRDLILSNSISVFDFKCYIFSRQMSLLLRLGNAHSSRTELSSKSQPPQSPTSEPSTAKKAASTNEKLEDPASLAELCERALSFITSTARDMRMDLLQAAKAKDIQDADTIIDNIVSSWTYAFAQQVLEETATPSLPVSLTPIDDENDSRFKLRSLGGRGNEEKVAMSEPKTMIHPARTTSLSATSRRASAQEPTYAITPRSSQVVYDQGQFPNGKPSSSDAPSQGAVAALEELAARRAELILIQRRVLEHVGKKKGWLVGWAALPANTFEEGLTEISLSDPEPADPKAASTSDHPTDSGESARGLLLNALITAVGTVEDFRRQYESVSDFAIRHFVASRRSKSADRIFGDLAILKFEMEDYQAAAMYFSRMAPVFGEDSWALVEMIMLKMYAKCLKKIEKIDDYVGTLLDILARSAARQRTIKNDALGTSTTFQPRGTEAWLDDDSIETRGYLSELLETLKQAEKDVTVPMGKFFGDIVVQPLIQHYEDKDGFRLQVQFRHLLEDPITIERIKVRLTSTNPISAKEIWLESTCQVNLKRGIARSWVDSNITTSGTYMVDTIILETEHLTLVHEPPRKPESTTPLNLVGSAPAASLQVAKRSQVLCFPRRGAFHAMVLQCPLIHIDQPRSIRIVGESGSNDIQRAELRIRAGSAGLRLRTADAQLIDGGVKIGKNAGPGIIRFSEMPQDGSVTFQVPYDLENNLSELNVKIDATYFTSAGEFQFASSNTLSIELPLDVNVLDHFKADMLISKFNIRTASNVPLEVQDVRLDGTDQFLIDDVPSIAMPLLVFPKQPVVFTYRIRPWTSGRGRALPRLDNKEPPLALSVLYRCLDEDVIAFAEREFAKDIEQSDYRQFSRALTPFFVERIKQRVASQMEAIALLNRMRLGSFENMSWAEALEGLPNSIREGVREWLQTWHQEHNPLDVSAATTTKNANPTSRKIVITVPVPRIHVLHTVSLNVKGVRRLSRYSPPVAAVGEMFVAELRIQHTRRWDSEDSVKQCGQLSDSKAALEFVYEIGANPDVWLIGGQRRTQFSAKEDEMLTFSLLLMPLRPGIWLLPTVEIRPILRRPQQQQQQQQQSQEQEAKMEGLTCETDYQSQGETIQVIPDLKSATSGISQLAVSAPGGACTLLESQKRPAAEGVNVGDE